MNTMTVTENGKEKELHYEKTLEHSFFILIRATVYVNGNQNEWTERVEVREIEANGDHDELTEAINEAIYEVQGNKMLGLTWETIPGDDLPHGVIAIAGGHFNLSSTSNTYALAEYCTALEEADSLGIPAHVFAEVVGDYWGIIGDPAEIVVRGVDCSPREFALKMVDEFGGVQEMLSPDQIEGYLDYEKLGRDLLHDFVEIDGYILEVDA